MADEAYQDRTEQPTPKRRAEAREKGRVARSRDLSAALVLLTGLGLLALLGSHLGNQCALFLRSRLAELQAGRLTPAHLPVLMMNCGLVLGKLLAPIWAVLVTTAILANFLQGGWVFAPGRLAPDLSRLQFFQGFKRLFSGVSLVELGKALAKVSLLGLVGYYFFKSRILGLLPLTQQEVSQILLHLKGEAFQLSWRLVFLLFFLGLLDYGYQRYRFEMGLRMTKQEVKDEMRQVEGDPRVRARLRSLMRQLASRRMMAAVPKADVVVTNPTRLAVALRYDSATMIAPQVVAKGRGFVALKIIAVAQEAKVPLVENRDLAQSLYRLVEVGDTIPTSLYRAVAEVLAYIYSLRAAAGGLP